MARLTPNPAPERDLVRVRRRTVLAAGLGSAALGLAACAGQAKTPEVEPRKLESRAADDELPAETTPPQIATGPPLITGTFPSAKMRRDTRWAVVRPDGVSGRMPVVVVLHALNTNEKSIFSSKLEIQSVLQRYVDAGNPPFAIAAADAGRNYYHRRADGTDGAAMVLDEFIPMLANNRELNVSTERIGLFGWSMGGYGALRLASLLGAPRVAAVAVSSPALWADPRNFPPRAFDGLADYQANSLFGTQDAFAKIPLMISVGSSDQFFTYTRQWAAGLHPPAAFGTSAGGHTNRYWRSVLPDQVEFLGRNLAS
ncbi:MULTISPECIES: alpha/beta hydrolase family protein [unclassified Gordonia (in: high G+C Gram-positive bacteria)]|uniref:alpha/beta hydrolase n=1 Tax=unclassified Gordonia (in: high G+C Gram-positive bacteria) TaxID=2657482 RepID=UPI001F109C13|nr:alpha/beta hydrolase-fold protein [Gordonia sp. ABSL49_1]MCH5645264.1 esterase family protein [Gordonia sp. ABSL49_1]